MSDKEPVCKKSKTVSFKRFQYQWFDDNPSWRAWIKDVPDDRSKFFCKSCESTLACGLSEIKRHSKAEKHIKNMKKLNLNYNIDNIKLIRISSIDADNSGQPEKTQSLSKIQEEDFDFNERVKIAEIRLVTFVVENNLPVSMLSDLLSFMKDIVKHPGILQAMSL